VKRNYQTEVVSRIKGLDGKAELREAGSINHLLKEYPMYYLVSQSPNPASRNILISAGIHGDEPAGVYSALDFAENRMHDYAESFSFVIVPCINPAGFEKGTRVKPNGIDLNREFKKAKPEQEVRLFKDILKQEGRKYCVAIDMHEDDPRGKVDGFPKRTNPNGFYLYEVCPEKASIGPKIINILKSQGFPICSRKKVYWDENDHGVIWEEWGNEKRYEELTTLMAYLRKYAAHALNPETIPTWKLEKRVQAHKIVLETILDNFRKR
jgi:protein MpaA